MDLLKDISEIVKDNKEYCIEISIKEYSVTIYLKHRVYYGGHHIVQVIPVEYITLSKSIQIPYDELVCENYSINITGIKLIYNIMTYIENNKTEIDNICRQYNNVNIKK